MRVARGSVHHPYTIASTLQTEQVRRWMQIYSINLT